MLPSSAAPFCLFWLPWCISCVSELRMLLAGAVSKSIQRACHVSRTLIGLQLREKKKERKIKNHDLPAWIEKAAHEIPPSPEDLPAAMVAGGSRVLGFFRNASPAGLPCSIRHTCGTERAHWVLGGVREVGREKKRDVGEVGGEGVRVDLIKTRYIHVPNDR